MDTTAQQIIEAYLAECRRTAGDARTDMMRVTYNPRGGWFFLRSPYKTGPNRWTVSGAGRGYRAAQIERMTFTLKGRRDFVPPTPKLPLDNPTEIGYDREDERTSAKTPDGQSGRAHDKVA